MNSNDAIRKRDPVSLAELLAVLRAGRWWVLTATLSLGMGAAIVALGMPKRYEATVLMAHSTEQSGDSNLSSLSGLAGQFSGLASLAGINASGGNKEESLAVLQSRTLTERYIRENGLLPAIFHDKWDAQRNQWEGQEEPSLLAAALYFDRKIRDVRVDPRTGLVTLKIRWKEAQTAADWANGLVKLVNEYQRSARIAEAERHIKYLNEEAARTTVVEVRQAIYATLQGEINKVMLAKGSVEYVFHVIDPAVAAERSVSPRPILAIAVGLFLGLILSSFILLLRFALR